MQSDRNGTRPTKSEAVKVKKAAANRAVAAINSLKTTLRNWYTFYDGYDPVFTWWAGEPYKALDQTLTSYAAFLSERVVGIRPAESAGVGPGSGRSGSPADLVAEGGGQGDGQGAQRQGAATARPGDASDIVGDPIGREALLSELRSEMIPYTPEELIAIAEKEMAWCETEMKKASHDLGYGDDWHKALEHVKTLYVEPGKQPEMIRDLALEAIKFVDDHDLVTVPQLARDTWRMEMMTPERQLVSPFFLGGEVILVSFPTNTMSHEQKMMSMRGNNIHFRARHRLSRTDSRTSPAGLHDRALQTLPRFVRHAVLDRRQCALLGAVVLGFEVSQDAGEPHRHALLADASLRAHHFFAQLSSGKDDAAGMHRPAGEESRARAGQRDRRSAAVV